METPVEEAVDAMGAEEMVTKLRLYINPFFKGD